MISLKNKTVSGLLWSFIDSFAGQGVVFVVGLILARILSPREFGLIGMITIFIAISQSFTDSGFGSALIRKKNCTQEDYSTVFYFNIAVSILFTVVLFLSAGQISRFFNEPELKLLVRVLSIGIILQAVGVIQRTILTKNVDFKKQTKISLISSIGSGTLAIVMALQGFGVWSLVALTLTGFCMNSLLLWVWGKWRPKLIFNIISFKELFGFGSKLLLSGLLETVYRNVFYLVIGKNFSASTLGLYTRADQFNTLPSQQFTQIIGRVSYPIMCSIQDNSVLLKLTYKKLIRSTMFLSFLMMLDLAVISESLVLFLIGEKWMIAAEYLQLLCFVGMLYPLHALNLSMLKVKGRSDLFLKLEIIKKILAVPVVIFGIFFGIKIMITSMFVHSLLSLYLNSYWSGKLISYSIKEQILDTTPSLIFAIFVTLPVHLISSLFDFEIIKLLILQLLLTVFLTLGYGELSNFRIYQDIKKTFLGVIKSYL